LLEAEACATEEDGGFKALSVPEATTRRLMDMILLFIPSATEFVILWVQ
jgi:hypothetical protein